MREISDALPGADLIRDGLRDLANGVESVPALLVLVGAPRLRDLGLDVDDPFGGDYPEHRLYDRLAAIPPLKEALRINVELVHPARFADRVRKLQ
ncbi:MAG: hypothetical protein ACXW31_14280 [Thermoanaerobaculia bacterium]